MPHVTDFYRTKVSDFGQGTAHNRRKIFYIGCAENNIRPCSNKVPSCLKKIRCCFYNFGIVRFKERSQQKTSETTDKKNGLLQNL